MPMVPFLPSLIYQKRDEPLKDEDGIAVEQPNTRILCIASGLERAWHVKDKNSFFLFFLLQSKTQHSGSIHYAFSQLQEEIVKKMEH